MATLGRGQQEVVVKPPPPTSSALKGRWVLLISLGFIALCGIVSRFETSGSSHPDSAPTPSVGNLAPRPQGQYAALVPKGDEVTQAFVFSEDYLELRVVASESEIPASDRNTAMRPQRDENITSAGPVILHGAVDITAGPVADYDLWAAEYQTVNGEVVNFRILYDGTKLEEVRGPPEARKVYIVGSVDGIKTPETFGASQANVTVIPLDLRPERDAFDRYLKKRYQTAGQDPFDFHEGKYKQHDHHPPVERPVPRMPHRVH